MTTALDMISAALKKLGVFASGETIDAASAADSLKALNDMLDSWSNEALACFAIQEQSVTLVAGKSSYTIGPGGDVNGIRPLRLIEGPGAAYLLDTNENRYPVSVVPRDKWNEIWNIVSTTSNLPDTLFYDPQFPLGTINIYPAFNGTLGVALYFDSYAQLSGFAGLTTAVSLPPGYVKAVQDNLALELAPYFKPDNWQPPALLLKQAAESKGNIKRANTRENIAELDHGLIARGGSYNVYSDTAGR